jgi:biopolymer transport protein ExbD
MSLNRKGSAVKSDINIAPFTDVILVLLIIFMIATPALMQSVICVNIPKADVAAIDSKDNSSIEVLISKDGDVYMEGKQVENSNIESVVRKLIAENPGQAIIIKGDEVVQYGYVIQFMDKAKKAGAKKFALAVETKSITAQLAAQ